MKRLALSMMCLMFASSVVFAQGEKPMPTPPEKVVVSYNVINAIAGYLSKQPYVEVESLLNALKSGVTPYSEDKGEVKDAKAGKVEKQGVSKEKKVEEKASEAK